MTANPFHGRQAELAELAEQLVLARRTGRGRLVALRGRRQVGKSRLLEQFVASSEVPYAVVNGMKATPVSVQMQRAVESLQSAERPLPRVDVFTLAPLANWFDLLGRLRSAGLGDPGAVVVIDEFPWAVATDPGLDGLLQALWDQELSRLPVVLVLVGSDEAMMRQLFGHDQPLFGRVAHQMVLRPFDPGETALALAPGPHPALDVLDRYLMTGGFPELVAQASRFRSAKELARHVLASPHNVLADMARITLAGELTESANARLVLEAMGADEIGELTFSRIASALGGGKAAETAVTRSTDLLVDKGIVAIDQPAGSRRGRLKRYRIADPYLRSWFRFVEPHLRNIEVGRSDLAVTAFEAGWPSWCGKAIEPIVRDGVLRLAPDLPPPFDAMAKVDAWWDRAGHHECDLVGTDTDGQVVALGSIKWRQNARFGATDLAALRAMRDVVPHGGDAALLAVAPHGATTTPHPDLMLDAGDLLEAWRS